MYLEGPHSSFCRENREARKQPGDECVPGRDFVGLGGEDDKGLVSFADRQLKELQWA